MLLDTFMPHFDVRERHATLVNATPQQAYDAILRADLAAHPVARVLMALRGMGRRTARPPGQFAEGFAVAAENPPSEIVIGVEGPFWKPACRPRGVDAERFRTAVPSGNARGAWNFFVEEAQGSTRVTTETRVLCADDARWKFRLYWLLIRPFSGLIRRMMLRAIRREAETGK